MTGEVHTYRERLRQQILHPECNADLAAKSLTSHRQVQHVVVQGNLRDPPLKLRRTYGLSLPRKVCGITCLVGGCPGRATTWSTLWVHFVRCHVQDTLEVLEEGSHPHPHCIKCDIFVTYRVLNRSHQATGMCYS